MEQSDFVGRVTMTMGVSKAEPNVNKDIGAATFRNWHLTSVWAFVAFFTIWGTYLLYPRVSGLVLATIAGYAVYATTVISLGVTVTNRFIAAPMPLSPQFPFLILGRTRIALPSLLDMTALGTRFQSVGLRTLDGEIPVLFSTREKRLAFFATIRKQRPDTPIYKAYP